MGREYTSALRDGRCEEAEGTVKVIYMQPATGHAPGDRIRVANREFQFSDSVSTLAYNQTLAQRGVLTDGARARLHHLIGKILKVEVAK